MPAEEVGGGPRRVWRSLAHSRNLFRRAPRRARDNAWLAIASAYRLAEQHAQAEWERRLPGLREEDYETVFFECLEAGMEKLRELRWAFAALKHLPPPPPDT
jgi:hypothetical protein